MGLPSECRWNQKATSRPSRWSVSASILALPTQASPSPVAAAQEVALLGAFGLHPNQRSPAQAPGTLGLSRCTALAMPVHPGPWCRHIWEAANRCFSLSLPLSPPLCLKAMRKCPWVRIKKKKFSNVVTIGGTWNFHGGKGHSSQMLPDAEALGRLGALEASKGVSPQTWECK